MLLLYTFSLIIVFYILLSRLIKWYQNYYFGDALKLPGPSGMLLFGNLFDTGFNVEEIIAKFIEMRQKYGPIFGIWLSSFNHKIVLSHPLYVEKIFTSNLHLNKGSAYEPFIPLIGNGLLNSGMTHWKKDRKILNHAFHVKLLTEFVNTFNHVWKGFADNLKERSLNDDIELIHSVKSYALDAICETIMGVSVSEQKNKNKKFARAVEDYIQLIMTKFFSIPMRIKLYYRLTNYYKTENGSLNVIKEFVRVIIRNRELKRKLQSNRNNIDYECDGMKRSAFLDLLLDLKRDDIYTEQEVMDQAITFLLGGNFTITSSLSFFLYEISKHPEIQLKILQELDTVLGPNNDDDDDITFEDTQKFQYMECVIKESLRMYPPVTLFERSLQEDIIIGDFTISKNTNVLFFPYGSHHDKTLFPDPEKFDPDRFSKERIDEIPPYAYFPFSLGTRNCIGMPFAMCQLKVAIGNILRKLEFKPIPSGHKPKLFSDVILKSANGLPVIISER